MARIKEDTDRSNATAETYAKQVSDLTIELEKPATKEEIK